MTPNYLIPSFIILVKINLYNMPPAALLQSTCRPSAVYLLPFCSLPAGLLQFACSPTAVCLQPFYRGPSVGRWYAFWRPYAVCLQKACSLPAALLQPTFTLIVTGLPFWSICIDVGIHTHLSAGISSKVDVLMLAYIHTYLQAYPVMGHDEHRYWGIEMRFLARIEDWIWKFGPKIGLNWGQI